MHPNSGEGYTPPWNAPRSTENLSPLGRLGWTRWRVVGLVALVGIVAWVAYLQANSGKSERTYTKSEVTQFEYLAASDSGLSSLTQVDRARLVKPAENACTYRLDGHSEAQMVHYLETTGDVPVSLGASVANDAQTAFCPVTL